jgi:hypothetical protein
MLVDQLGNQPGQVPGRQPVIQRRRQPASVLSTGGFRPPEMRVGALSKSYFEQFITALISDSSSRAPCPKLITPPGVLPT